MDEEEFDEINKKLSRKQRLMLSFLSMDGDSKLPVEERLKLVEYRHNHLVSKGLIDNDLFDRKVINEEMEGIRGKIHAELKEDHRLHEAAHKAVFGGPTMVDESGHDVLAEKKKKPKPRDYMYG